MKPANLPSRLNFRQVTAVVALALPLLSLSAQSAGLTECTVKSGTTKVGLLELYTSEGCSSCPPVDAWTSGLPKQGFTTDKLVILAFHVDYWDDLGWKDPFSKKQFSERQRNASQRLGSGFVYTPQLILNGKVYRKGFFGNDLAGYLDGINRQRPQADLELGLFNQPGLGTIRVNAKATLINPPAGDHGNAYIALYENNLGGHSIPAGENAGRVLRHNFVVRELYGPISIAGTVTLEHTFSLKPGGKPADSRVAFFIENGRNGDILQAMSVPLCP